MSSSSKTPPSARVQRRPEASKRPFGQDAPAGEPNDPVDEAGLESFPASDPPAWIVREPADKRPG